MRTTIQKRFIILGSIIIIVIFASALGYYIIKITFEDGKHATAVDAIYWAVVTLSTLGSYPHGVEFTSQVGKLFTVAVVSMGILIIFVGLPLVFVPWFEARLERAVTPKESPVPPGGHVIVCNYTEMGKEVIADLKLHGVDYILIENDTSRIPQLIKDGVPYILGDPSTEDCLEKANVSRAMSLIATGEDSVNAFICLTAKKLNPELRIIASVHNPAHRKILHNAGASRTVSPRSITGTLIGQRAIGKYDMGITDKVSILKGLEIHQYTVTDASPFVDISIREAQIGRRTGVVVIGVWDEGKLTVNPSPDTVLRKGMTLLVMGKEEHLSRLENM